MANGDFESRFNRFKEDFGRVLADCRERNQREAPEFNIFEIARIESNEAVHSRMLSTLLNPDGTHGQGPLFLTRFIRHCENKVTGFPKLLDRDLEGTDLVQVISEFGSVDGRPDIVIYSRSPAFALIIENKIYAGDQDKQLSRYRKLLDESFQFAEGRKALIYLSIWGRRCSENSAISEGDYSRLSYKTDVKEWLQSCCEKIPPRVHELLRQYLDTLDSITDEVPTEASETTNT
jgi:hypothetical protein